MQCREKGLCCLSNLFCIAASYVCYDIVAFFVFLLGRVRGRGGSACGLCAVKGC